MEEETQQEISTSWHSYPKIYAIGHALIRDIFSDDVLVEEKIDGSAFSAGVFGGELKIRSKSCVMNIDAPEKMFNQAVATVKDLQAQGLLRDGWTYRFEYLAKPKHNALAYDRVPARHLIGYDINDGHESYMSYEDKAAEFGRLGLETVPLLYAGKVEHVSFFRGFLDCVSILGGQKVEGVVVKNYSRFGPDGKALLGKFVSEAFKEVHQRAWKESNPSKGDFLLSLIDDFTCPARWNKAIQHLRERGELEGSPRDIGKLIREVPADIQAECEPDIKERLFAWAWPQIQRGCVRGLAEFYKEQLLKSAFEEDETPVES